MRALPWILGGGAGALAAYYWTRRDRSEPAQRTSGNTSDAPIATHDQVPGRTASSSAATSAPTEPLPGRWVWPVGVWRGRKPEISDGFDTTRTLPSGQVVKHGGVDIMYRRKPSDPWKAGTTNAVRDWVMPDHRAALAASDGVVRYARNTPRGWSVVIDHAPNHLATYYTHMSSLLVSAKQAVRAGTPLGVIGADPLDAAHLMHAHFELWHGDYAGHFDPRRLMEKTWEYLPDPGDQSAQLVARNAKPRAPSQFVVPVQAHYRRLPRR
jgi:murein DD-endopeptidase MepM/ murein hydrolase activator NlpD